MEPEQIIAEADSRFDEVVDLRRWFHAHPELSFAEHETTAAIRDRLGGLGLRALPCPTETGAVFALDGGRPGRTVLVRADIDALPVDEPDTFDFHSIHDGIMHACGHDAHTAIALGVADIFATRADDLPGRYVFLFQPAEESANGARTMIDGGVLDGLAIDRAVGLHVAGFALPAGLVMSRPGTFFAEASVLQFTVAGPGGHGAMMGAAGNVVLAACDLAARLGDVVMGLDYKSAPCVCNATTVHAGRAVNVVPTVATVIGTLRTFSPEQRAIVDQRMTALIAAIGTEFEVEVQLDLLERTGAVRNDPGATTEVLDAVGGVLGADNAFVGPPISPSDDMSEFLDRIPGCYFLVGAQPKGATVLHHSASFAIDEQALAVGVKALAAGALALATPAS